MLHKQRPATNRINVRLMGVINTTPDSFSDGGLWLRPAAAVRQALRLIAEGADCIDIGGESSRPGAAQVSVATELRRVVPVIKELRKKTSVPISIDTYKPAVAEAALKAGANWVNDITGLADPVMRQLVAKARCMVIIMHMQGTPQTMQQKPHYRDVVNDIARFFRKRLALAHAAGIKHKNIILDPGIGFGKTVVHNLEIIQRLGELKTFRLPLIIGASRKSFIGKLTGAAVADRLPGTLAVHGIAVANGATWLRVHDVAAHKQYLSIRRQLSR